MHHKSTDTVCTKLRTTAVSTTVFTQETHPQQDPFQVHPEQTSHLVGLQHTDELLSFQCAQHVWHPYLYTSADRYVNDTSHTGTLIQVALTLHIQVH